MLNHSIIPGTKLKMRPWYHSSTHLCLIHLPTRSRCETVLSWSGCCGSNFFRLLTSSATDGCLWFSFSYYVCSRTHFQKLSWALSAFTFNAFDFCLDKPEVMSLGVCHRPYCIICDSLSYSLITFSQAACKACPLACKNLSVILNDLFSSVLVKYLKLWS